MFFWTWKGIEINEKELILNLGCQKGKKRAIYHEIWLNLLTLQEGNDKLVPT